MLRNATAILGIILVLGCFGLHNAAFANGDDEAGGSRCGGLRGDHFRRGFGINPGYGYYRNRESGSRGGFHGYGSRDVWGHWGTYYGPMI
jgi:hypothetical protein